MSELIIHYSSLETAVKKLDGISSSLNSYADTINTQVSRKLLNYTGARTTYINDAGGFARKKMDQLRAKAQAFTSYATKVSTFVVNAKQADMKIKSRVDELTGKFKAKYGIRTSAIDMVFSFINNLLNKTALGRAFKDLLNKIGVALDSILGRISDWYNYEGGKYLLKNIGLAVLSVALAVLTIVLLPITAPLAVIIAAGVLLGVAILNLGATIANSAKAYSLMQGDNPDPAWAQRYGKITTYSDHLRKNTDSKLAHAYAIGLDIATAAAGVVMTVYSISQIYKSVKNFIEIKRFSSQLATEPNTSTFWSGKSNGVGGEGFANNYASANGRVTLESTISNNNVNMPKWDLNNSSSLSAWDNASAAYARNAAGDVKAILGDNLRPGNVWQRVELPTLLRNPNVTSITTINPATLAETVIYTGGSNASSLSQWITTLTGTTGANPFFGPIGATSGLDGIAKSMP